MNIKPVKVEDAEALTNIALAAKQHWKYPKEWLELWKEGLTITTKFIEENNLYKAVEGTTIIGFCAIIYHADKAEIEHCWVLPSSIGKGIGKRLLDYAFEQILENNFHIVEVVSDPNAIGFYQKIGFQQIGTYTSQPQNRQLPILQLDLKSVNQG